MTREEKIKWLENTIDNTLAHIKAGENEIDGVNLENHVMKAMAKLDELNKPPDLGVNVSDETETTETMGQ